MLELWALYLERASSDIVSEIPYGKDGQQNCMSVEDFYVQGFVIQAEGKVTVLHQLVK